MGKLNWLREHCEAVMQEAPDRYWLAYQVLDRLREDEPEVVDDLVREYSGAVGPGGGHHTGPAWAISQCLGHWYRIDRQYVQTNGLRWRDADLSPYGRIAIFRLNGQGG